MITHIKNRGEMLFPLHAWLVVASSMGGSPASAYIEPVLLQEIASMMGEVFDNNIGESMPLQE